MSHSSEDSDRTISPPPLLEREDWTMEVDDDGPPELEMENGSMDDEPMAVLELEGPAILQRQDIPYIRETTNDESEYDAEPETENESSSRQTTNVTPIRKSQKNCAQPSQAVSNLLRGLHYDLVDYQNMIMEVKKERDEAKNNSNHQNGLTNGTGESNSCHPEQKVEIAQTKPDLEAIRNYKKKQILPEKPPTEKVRIQITEKDLKNVDPYLFVDIFKCGACSDVVQSNVSLRCKHIFCASCLTGDETNCPVCDREIKSAFHDSYLDPLINTLKVNTLRKKPIAEFVKNPFDPKRVPVSYFQEDIADELQLIRPPMSYFGGCEEDFHQSYVPHNATVKSMLREEAAMKAEKSQRKINVNDLLSNKYIKMEPEDSDYDFDDDDTNDDDHQNESRMTTRSSSRKRQLQRRSSNGKRPKRNLSNEVSMMAIKKLKSNKPIVPLTQSQLDEISAELAKHGFPLALRSRYLDLGNNIKPDHHNMFLLLKEKTQIGHLIEYIRRYYHEEYNLKKEDMKISIIPVNWSRSPQDVVLKKDGKVREFPKNCMRVCAQSAEAVILHPDWFVQQYREYKNIPHDEVIDLLYDVEIKAKKKPSTKK